jgi:predicted dehydrogenase
MAKKIRFGLVGAGWMGKSHASAFRNAALVFRSRLPEIELRAVADVNLESARTLALANGCSRWTTDYNEIINDPEIDVVDITTPNDTHFVIARAAIAAGKHIYCEKPLTLDSRESQILTDEANAAGLITLVGFNYLMNPAQSLARHLIQSGEIGEVISFRGIRDGDAAVDPLAPFSWRHDRKIAGSGALGDTGTHALSMAQMLVGDIDSVFGFTKTFIKERPVSVAGSGYSSRADLTRMRAVENDDTTLCMLTFKNGAVGSMSCSRVATGRRAWLTYEIQGTKGGLFFTQQRMNELQFYRHSDPPSERGYKTIYIGPEHGIYSAFHPIPGMQIGYNDLKIIEVHELLTAIEKNMPAFPDFEFANKIAKVVDAILLSAEEGRWTALDELHAPSTVRE